MFFTGYRNVIAPQMNLEQQSTKDMSAAKVLRNFFHSDQNDLVHEVFMQSTEHDSFELECPLSLH